MSPGARISLVTVQLIMTGWDQEQEVTRDH